MEGRRLLSTTSLCLRRLGSSPAVRATLVPLLDTHEPFSLDFIPCVCVHKYKYIYINFVQKACPTVVVAAAHMCVVSVHSVSV